MPLRKPLPIGLDRELLKVPEVANTEVVLSAEQQRVKELTPVAIDALEEIIEDADHKDRYNASVLILKNSGVIEEKRDRGLDDDIKASENVIKLIKEIGELFGAMPMKKARKVKATDVEVVEVSKYE